MQLSFVSLVKLVHLCCQRGFCAVVISNISIASVVVSILSVLLVF